MKTSQYAWNSAPIDNTDIQRSVAAVGRAFKFPLDLKLQPTPTLNDDHNTALFDYLRHVSCSSSFSLSILLVLVEERREYHRNRSNSNKTASPLKVGDVVKAHVAVNSSSESNVVSKLSYQIKGPFIITKELGHDSFEVRRYNKPNSKPRKYKSTELYLLPPQLFPSNELDTMDQRYLNYSHASIPSPL